MYNFLLHGLTPPNGLVDNGVKIEELLMFLISSFILTAIVIIIFVIPAFVLQKILNKKRNRDDHNNL